MTATTRAAAWSSSKQQSGDERRALLSTMNRSSSSTTVSTPRGDSGGSTTSIYVLLIVFILGAAALDVVFMDSLLLDKDTTNGGSSALAATLSAYRHLSKSSKQQRLRRRGDGSSTRTDQQQAPSVVPPKKQVYLLPAVPREERTANALHLILDGVEQSPLLEFTSNIYDTCNETSIVWILDLLVARGLSSRWCQNFVQQIRDVQTYCQQSTNTTGGSAPGPIRWPIVVVDNRDQSKISACPGIGEVVGDENVIYSFRSLVVDREWNKQAKWVTTGRVITQDRDYAAPQYRPYHYRHRPIGVRTDLVASIAHVWKERGMTLCDRIEATERSIDVSYFWKFANFEDDDALLRDQVYSTLQSYKEGANYTVELGLKGARATKGRKKVSGGYVDALIDSKIVVVAQRDEWEDHYRLLEAVVSGSLVFTDKMLSLPKGLKDGESVVEYSSAKELKDQLDLYLTHPEERIRVAQNGRRVAMSRHRSWHHMEEAIFGSPVTVCSEHTGSQCPYIANADEIQNDCPAKATASQR